MEIYLLIASEKMKLLVKRGMSKWKYKIYGQNCGSMVEYVLKPYNHEPLEKGKTVG